MQENFTSLTDNMLQLIAPGGSLSHCLPGYCFRNEQQELIRAITQSFNDDTYLLAEAGTGVGKSLAYLLPAAYYSAETGDKVIIATKTKALQDQLINHDLPLLKKILPFGFTYDEARGRENYLCPARLQRIVRGRTELDSDETKFVESIAGWTAKTKTGDRKELHLDSHLMRHWHLVSSNRHFCQSGNCGYEESCFRLKARRRWEEADLLITNHALLLVDAQMGRVLLPEYHTLIIDEAHQLPRQAQEHFSLRMGILGIRDLTGRLHSKIGGIERGLLPLVRLTYPQLETLIQEVILYKNKVEITALDFFTVLADFLVSRWQGSPRVRLTGEDREQFWSTHADEWSRFLQRLAELDQVLQVLAKELPEEERNQFLGSIQAQLTELLAATAIVEFDWGTRNKVVWAEHENNNIDLCLVSAPLHPGDELQKTLYSGVQRLVMVSATMSVNQRFDYFIHNCGLEDYDSEERLSTVILASPFDYANNCQVFIPSDIAAPGEPLYEMQVANTIARLAMVAKQRCLVLFTSHSHLKLTAQKLRPVLSQAGVPLLVQNEDGPFTRLVSRLQEQESGVLMGTDTFWEGVDLPGNQMSLLIIVRLPFRSPADPFYQAWLEEMPSGKVFADLMIPEAVLKMKQGMGRLIRSEHDRGNIVILDRRMLPPPQGKGYANQFISSLPMGKPQLVNLEQLLRSVVD